MAISKNVKNKIPFVGAILALLPSLWIEFTARNFFLAIVLLCILVLNIVALRLKTDRLYLINIFLHFLNALAMVLIAYQFMAGGKTYLHYPYFVACSGFIFAGILHTLRYKKSNAGIDVPNRQI